MSLVETILIIGALIVPIIALIAIKPRFKKHSIPPETMPYVSSENDKEEKKEIINKEVKKTEQNIFNDDASSLDFKDYLNHKKKRTSIPNRNMLPEDFEDMTMPYRRNKEKRDDDKRSINEQIMSLSPELLAMILSGAFDKRYFD